MPLNVPRPLVTIGNHRLAWPTSAAVRSARLDVDSQDHQPKPAKSAPGSPGSVMAATMARSQRRRMVTPRPLPDDLSGRGDSASSREPASQTANLLSSPFRAEPPLPRKYQVVWATTLFSRGFDQVIPQALAVSLFYLPLVSRRGDTPGCLVRPVAWPVHEASSPAPGARSRPERSLPRHRRRSSRTGARLSARTIRCKGKHCRRIVRSPAR